MKIRWIHFSDLHLGEDKDVDTRLMRRKLPVYIAGLNQRFDYAFCSGDIKEWNHDYTNADKYLENLCEASNTPLNRLFLVPGNHDVKIGNEERSALIKELTNPESIYYESNSGLISDEDYGLLKSGQTDFIKFVDQFLGADRATAYQKPHFTITTEHFNIVHLDTTLTYDKGRDRNFIIGTRALMDALEECDKSLATIILTHYSFDYLDMKEKDQVETILNEYHVQLWIAGHEHENLIRKQRDKFLECQCGNIMLQRGARSCFLTGEYDTDSKRSVIMVHAWYEGKGWERYPFARIGSEDDSVYPFVLGRPDDVSVVGTSAEWINASEACSRLSYRGDLFDNTTINSAILTDLEIADRFYRNCGEEPPLIQVMRDLWSKNDHSRHALLLGDGGMGKSTALYHACQQLLSSRRLAIYISLQAREGAEGESVIDYILRCLYQSNDDRARSRFHRLVSSEHPEPDLVLLIDGFNELTGAGSQRYVAQIKELSHYAGIQIIISSRLDFLRDFGLNQFDMIRTCDLREEQAEGLFDQQPKAWKNIQQHKNLRILVKNPMMALLYANTCPIIDKHMGLDYLDWIVPIANASDLLHDYYLSQIALLIDRHTVDGKRIFYCRAAIEYLLSDFAYMMERKNKTVTMESDFDTYLEDAVTHVNERFQDNLPENLRVIKRKFRLRDTMLSQEEAYDLIISEMCLLKSGNSCVSFNHQVYRDYLAAVHLKQCLLDEYCIEKLWHREEIHSGVIEYLRNMGDETVWGTEGKATQLLLPYRGKEVAEDDRFIENIINCWLSQGDGERDLSYLDLRRVSLTKHLRTKFSGTINIDHARVNKQVFINDKCHDKIIAICFSHDNRTMAAVSCNGIVSITNLSTQSQMIIAELTPCAQVIVGFDSEDYLIVKNDSGTYKWPTIAYDVCEEGNIDDILTIPLSDSEAAERIKKLKTLLKESDLEGVYSATSENGLYLATGFDSGFMQVWDTVTQDCIAKYSLSDSQIVSATFSKDGKIAALGSGGNLVQIWNVIEGKHQRTLFFEKRVSAVEFLEHDYQLTCQLSDGTYCKVDTLSGEISAAEKPPKKELISKALQRLAIQTRSIDIAPHGNAVLIDNSGKAFTWDERLKKLSPCSGHLGQVSLVAICKADERFAASYSNERYSASRNDGKYRHELNGQKLVRVRIVKTGQCQRRLPTKGRNLTKLQFYTSNRIVLAGFATNGDILLWELINQRVGDKEYGRWNTVEIVRSNQAEPLECAVPADKKSFISAFSDGTIIIRPFENAKNTKVIKTFPGIDAEVFRWDQLTATDDTKEILSGY